MLIMPKLYKSHLYRTLLNGWRI